MTYFKLLRIIILIRVNTIYEEGGCRMATSSFSKNFTLSSKKAVDSFEKIISTPTNKVKIDPTLISPENKRRGEIRLKQMLSH